MNLQKRNDSVRSRRRTMSATPSRTRRVQPWKLDLTLDDVMVDLDPGTLVWREHQRDK